jgi:hypothetical protein
MERYGLPAPGHRFGRAPVTISSTSWPGSSTVTSSCGRQWAGSTAPASPSPTGAPTGSTRSSTAPATPTRSLSWSAAASTPRGLATVRTDLGPPVAGLAHVGLVQPLGSAFPVVEAQARILGDWLSGAYALPGRAAMLRSIRRSHHRRNRRYIPSDRHALLVDEPDYSQRLKRERRRGGARVAEELARSTANGRGGFRTCDLSRVNSKPGPPENGHKPRLEF